MDNLPIEIPQGRLAEYCRRWKIADLYLFGSALRDDFGADSDLDLLVVFDAEACWSLLDLVAMEDELSAIVGRPVDLVTRASIEHSANPYRREAILGSARKLHVA